MQYLNPKTPTIDIEKIRGQKRITAVVAARR
jgi:hypothetical protein